MYLLFYVPTGHRDGKIGQARWASPVCPKLGLGWAIKLLARKKPGQIWPSPVWPSPIWPGPARLTRFFFCLEKTIWPDRPGLAQPARFLGQVGLLKFWPEKTGPILARPGFGSTHYWPGPSWPGPPDCHL